MLVDLEMLVAFVLLVDLQFAICWFEVSLCSVSRPMDGGLFRQNRPHRIFDTHYVVEYALV